MTTVWDLDLPYLDPLDPSFVAASHERNAEALARSWVAMTPFGPAVLGHRQVAALFRDARLETVSLQSTLELQGVTEGPFFERATRGLLGMDGADHVRLRRLLAPMLSPRAVAPLRPAMRARVHSSLDRIGGGGRCEAIGELVAEYARGVICALLSLPPEDGTILAGWARDEMSMFDFDLEHDRPRIEAAHAGFDAYLAPLIADRRRRPGADLVSRLLAGAAEVPLSDAEAAMLVENVIVGGIDTTANQLGLALWALALAPDQWELVANEDFRKEAGLDAATVPAAVEESLRWHSTVGGVFRRCAGDVEVDGVCFPAGTILNLGMGTANRDPDAHPCPHSFDATRLEPSPVLAFGMGAHHCIGANLARAALDEALSAIAARWTRVEVDGSAELRTTSGLAGLERLPLRFDLR